MKDGERERERKRKREVGEREGERGKSEKLQVILNQTHTSRYDIMPSFLISKETRIALKCHQRELKKGSQVNTIIK